MFLVNKGSSPEIHQIAKQIDAASKAFIEHKPSAVSEEGFERDISFIGKPLIQLDSYLEKFVFPNINKIVLLGLML